MILQDVDDKYDKKNTLPFLANCKTRSLFWHLKNMADRGYGLTENEVRRRAVAMRVYGISAGRTLH